MKRLHELPTDLQKKLLLIELIDLYTEHEPMGGSLHIVLEDGNYDSVESCRKFAEENNDIWALTIINLMQGFSEEEVKQLLEDSYHQNYKLKFRFLLNY